MSYSELDFNSILPTLKPFGQDDDPFISKCYAKSSRRPSIDFSEWLFHRIEKHDIESIEKWIWEIVRFNPGMGGDLKTSWKNMARTICVSPAYEFLLNIPPKGIYELKTVLLLGLIIGGTGHSLVGYGYHKIIARVLLPYNFLLKDLSLQINHYDQYFKERGDFLPYEPIPTIDESYLHDLRNRPIIKDFNGKLGKISIPHRVALFQDYSRGENIFRQAVPSDGLDTDQLISLKLFDFVSDPHLIVRLLKKDELVEAMRQATDTTIKKSTTKKELQTKALEHPELLRAYAQQNKIVGFNKLYENNLHDVYQVIELSSPMIAIWLIFAFNQLLRKN